MTTTAGGGKGRGPAKSGATRPGSRVQPDGAKPRGRRRPPARPSEPATVERPAPEALEALASSVEVPLSLPVSTLEPVFAARVPPAPPERPRPHFRRAIFLDVENTSRAQHLAHVIDHLAVDAADRQTELIAVANWRVVGHEAARLLAQRGAHLLHSAPSTGVRDWSDLRIAVAAGLWLAGARPGDTIEIVSDDRAFDAVGDVAASLGITFHRLSYRRLVKEEAAELVPPAPRAEPREGAAAARGRRRRRRGGRGGGTPGSPRPGAAPGSIPAPPSPAWPLSPVPTVLTPRADEPGAETLRRDDAEAHTAPHDEIVSVVRELVATSPTGRVSIDTLANALKARGFRRPPGSPRLMTRLRRIREIAVSPTGAITLAGNGQGVAPWPAGPEVGGEEPGDSIGNVREPSDPRDGPRFEDDAQPAALTTQDSPHPGRRRRRRRRGGRGGRRPSSPTVPIA